MVKKKKGKTELILWVHWSIEITCVIVDGAHLQDKYATSINIFVVYIYIYTVYTVYDDIILW